MALDYAKVIGRFAIVRGDTSGDVDLDPDTVYVDAGTVTFTPVATTFRVADADPDPLTIVAAPVVATIGADGRLELNGTDGVWLLDLGSDELNPRVSRSAAAYTVTFAGLLADEQPVTIAPFGFHPVPDEDNDLSLLAPLAVVASVPITRGPQGEKGDKGDPGTMTDAELKTAIAAGVPFFHAERFKTGSLTDAQALHAACAAATALTRGAVVQLSSRTWDVGAGFSMSGYSCGLVGMGVSHNAGGGGAAAGSVLHAPTQAGAVLDLTGWTVPSSFRGKVEFGGFALRGSGVADPTKANIGLRRATTALSSVRIHDIVTSETGGPGVDMFDLYLSDVERVVAVNPVSAKANDVPYMIFRGCNGNRLYGLGFRSMDSSADVGVSGALIFTDDPGGNVCSTNEVIAPWFEFLHTPTNGTLISNAAKANRIVGPYFVDCAKESGATNTSCIHLLAPGTDQGGNEIVGMIPGAQTGVVDTGVRVSQSRNRITGVKGYDGGNVTLDSGVGFTYAALGGAISGTGTSAAFVDNSGQTTNTLLDFNRYPGAGRLPLVSTVTKTADTTRNNTATAAADPDLTIPVAANAVYLIEACIFYTATAAADLRLGITVPGSSTLAWSPDGPSTTVSNSASTAPHRGVIVASGGNASLGGIAVPVMAKPTGKLITGASSGALTFQWAQLAAEVSDAVVHAGSWIKLTRVA